MLVALESSSRRYDTRTQGVIISRCQAFLDDGPIRTLLSRPRTFLSSSMLLRCIIRIGAPIPGRPVSTPGTRCFIVIPNNDFILGSAIRLMSAWKQRPRTRVYPRAGCNCVLRNTGRSCSCVCLCFPGSWLLFLLLHGSAFLTC